MFSYLRSKMKIVFAIVAAAFLVTIFAFWGMDIDSRQLRGNVAFSVNGEDIPIRTYEQAVERFMVSYRGQDISESFRRQIRKQAAEDLINEKILEQTSTKNGIYVTPEELKGHVHAEFPNDDVYRTYLFQASPRWWQTLEESTDKRIKISRARWPILDAVWVSDAEWSKIVGDMFWEADLSHILFTAAREVTDSEVQDYYESHRHLILEPEKVRTRQILFKLPFDAAETEAVEVMSKAHRVLELARDGKDFAALAKKYSEAPDAEDGGDMGFYSPGDMLQEVENVAFALAAGQVHDTFVRTEFGLHILKQEERVPTTIRPWSEKLLEELQPSVVTDSHVDRAKVRAQRVLDTLLKFPDQFAVLASVHSQAISARSGGRVGWIPRLVFPSNYEREHLIGEVTQGAAIDRAISKAAFETPAGTVAPELVRSVFGWHIVKVHERRPIRDPAPTDTDAAIIRNTYLRLLSEQTLNQWLKD